MKGIKILDCTLRDGGYLIDSRFGESGIKGLIQGLTSSGMEIIEVGFLKDEPHVAGSTVFNNASQIENYLPQDRRSASYVCLADYSRYSIEKLEPYTGASIDGVRACFFKNEQDGVMEFCRKIKEKGYKLYVQPVDVLGYSDYELIQLISQVNSLGPEAFSIVDTFGSMYPEDLERVVHLIHHNLDSKISLGFHSHNNLQMSFSLAQTFVRLMQGKREIFVDTTLEGMGRGAGNTHTELMGHYLNRRYQGCYDLDVLLDLIDNYIDGYKKEHKWGYSIPYFVAGTNSTHVNNVNYLVKKAGLASRDINFILNDLAPEKRKRYDYNELEERYLELLKIPFDDTDELERLREKLSKRDIVMLLPGRTVIDCEEKIKEYCQRVSPVVISVNMILPGYPIDYLYFSNKNRYNQWIAEKTFADYKKIVTSNISTESEENRYIINFKRLIKTGWSHMDNSGILLLRLLDMLDVGSIAIAGFDGFEQDTQEHNYAIGTLEKMRNIEDAVKANDDIGSMLRDYMNVRKSKCPIVFLTQSRFEDMMKK